MTSSLLEESVAEDVSFVCRYRFTVKQYSRMTETGILPEGAPIELIDGLIVYKDRRDSGCDKEDSLMNQGMRHAYIVSSLIQLLGDVVHAGCHIRSQVPLQIGDEQLPEPDIIVLRGPLTDYKQRQPTADDALLVIEVADSSLNVDRSTKQGIYATGGIPHYWIVSVSDSSVEVYGEPDTGHGHYRVWQTHRSGDLIAIDLGTEHRITVAVSEILP